MVAREFAGAGGDQIAHARDAREGLRARPEGHPQAGHLREPARDQCRASVGAKAQPVADARPNGDDVLERDPQLDPQGILAGVDA